MAFCLAAPLAAWGAWPPVTEGESHLSAPEWEMELAGPRGRPVSRVVPFPRPSSSSGPSASLPGGGVSMRRPRTRGARCGIWPLALGGKPLGTLRSLASVQARDRSQALVCPCAGACSAGSVTAPFSGRVSQAAEPSVPRAARPPCNQVWGGCSIAAGCSSHPAGGSDPSLSRQRAQVEVLLLCVG